MSKQIIEGAEICLMLNDREGPITITNTERWQHVGRLTDQSNAIIMVTVKRDSGLFGLNVDGAKNVTLKRDHSPDNNQTAFFSSKVPIKASPSDGKDDTLFYTEYPANHIRLLAVATNGSVSLFEISLVSQKGEFFVGLQQVYQTRVYKDGTGIYCPLWPDNKWPQLMDLLGSLLKNHRSRLRDRSKCPPPEKVRAKSIEDNTGHVLWYNLAQGLGCVMTKRGAARVHWSNLAGMNGQCYLEEGQQVHIGELGKPAASLRRQTTFRREAYQVSVAN